MIPRPARRDWFGLLRDLRYQAGMSLSAVSLAIGIPETTVRNWYYRNNEPRHSDGEALLALYARVFNRQA